MAHMFCWWLLENFLASEKFLHFYGVLTGNICVGDDGTFRLEPPHSFDSDC